MKLTKKQRIIGRCLMLTIGLYMLSGCVNNMFYAPDHEVYNRKQNSSLNTEDVWFKSADGTKLHGWFIPATQPAPLGTVIHYHGNAGNLSAHISFTSWLPAEGYNVFIFDYRGYGKSEGSVDKEGIHQDSVAALKYIIARTEVTKDTLVVLGQSLGGNNALAAIDELKPKNIKAVIIDSTFYSYREIGADVLKNIPIISWLRQPLAWLLLNNNHSAKDTIASISPTPLLIFHDKGDGIIPFNHSEMLFESASDPKVLKLVNYGYHTSPLTRTKHRKELISWLSQIEEQ